MIQSLIFFLISVLWLMIWGGYNISYLANGFGWFNKYRSLLPLIPLILSFFVILFNLEYLSKLSPLNLILGYTLIGMIGAFFSTMKKRTSWWWAILFASPLLLLITIENPLYVSLIMDINWAIASVLSLGFMIFFLIQPGVIHSFYLNPSLILSIRPFEGWLGIYPGMDIRGITGTRPTGLARYSAIASLVMLCLFVTYNTWYSFLAFLIFTFILLFSKGKTEMGSFIIAMGFVLLLSHNLLSLLMLIYLLVIIFSYIIIFGHIHHKKPNLPTPTNTYQPVITSTVPNTTYFKKIFSPGIITLDGRVNGIWSDAISFIKRQLSVGYGFGSERYLLDMRSIDGTIFTTLLQSGIIGTALFLTSLAWVIIMGYSLIISGNPSLILLEAVSVGTFILFRGITQSFSLYSADWMFLVPLIAYIQVISSIH